MSIRTDLLRLPEAAWANEIVFFRPVAAEDDLIYAGSDCRLRDDQTDLVNPVWFTFGRAYLAPEDHVPCVICAATGERVGFLDFYNWRGDEPAYAWGYFIDAQQQGKGYGKAAARLAICLLKSANPAVPLRLAVEPENQKAQHLYRTLGFRPTPNRDGSDLIFAL